MDDVFIGMGSILPYNQDDKNELFDLLHITNCDKCRIEQYYIK